MREIISTDAWVPALPLTRALSLFTFYKMPYLETSLIARPYSALITVARSASRGMNAAGKGSGTELKPLEYAFLRSE